MPLHTMCVSITGGMGYLAAAAYKQLASLLSKHEQSNSSVMTWL